MGWVRLMAIVIALETAGCGGQTAAAPSPTAPLVTVTLSEGGCRYTGPDQLPAGNHVFHLRNQTPDKMWAGMSVLAQGHTYAEFNAYLEAQNAQMQATQSGGEPPDWAPVVAAMNRPASVPDDVRWTVVGGIYAFACGRHGTDANGGDTELGIWAAGPFEVKA